jgi:hypothetical protein
MPQIGIEIDGQQAKLREVWVHLQSISTPTWAPYRLLVPKSYAGRVFDPYNTKDISESWTRFLEKNIEELGTFILEAYLKSMASVLSENDGRIKWVLATVDQIVETENTVEIFGKALPFDPQRC